MTCVDRGFVKRLRQLGCAHQRSRQPAFPKSKFWCAATVMVAGTVSLAAHANAATFYSDDDGGYAQPAPVAPPRAQKPKRHAGKASDPKAWEHPFTDDGSKPVLWTEVETGHYVRIARDA